MCGGDSVQVIHELRPSCSRVMTYKIVFRVTLVCKSILSPLLAVPLLCPLNSGTKPHAGHAHISVPMFTMTIYYHVVESPGHECRALYSVSLVIMHDYNS